MRDTEMFLYECFECDGEGEAVYQVGVRDFDNGGYLRDEMPDCYAEAGYWQDVG